MKSGIYKIKNILNGKSYFGSSVDIDRRVWIHKWMLRKGTHHSILLQHAWDKSSERAFIFEVVALCDISTVIKRKKAEEPFLSTGEYNVAKSVDKAFLGRKHSAATRNKMSELKKGSNNPLFGKRHSEETRNKIRETNKIVCSGEGNPMYGKKRPDISIMNQKRAGCKRSDETKQKMRNARIKYCQEHGSRV